VSGYFILEVAESESKSCDDRRSDDQSVLMSSPVSGLWSDSWHCPIVASLLMRRALSDERTSLAFTIAAGLRQRSHFGVRALRNL
jgi:hypothetical protein